MSKNSGLVEERATEVIIGDKQGLLPYEGHQLTLFISEQSSSITHCTFHWCNPSFTVSQNNFKTIQ